MSAANLLNEVQIVNPDEGRARITAMAARIREPRARVWFATAAQYFFDNMERLAEPYTPEPVTPAKVAGVGKYQHPLGPVDPERVPKNLSPKALAMLTNRQGTHWYLEDPGEADVDLVGYGLGQGGRAIPVPKGTAARWYGPRKATESAGAIVARLLEGEPYQTSLHTPEWQAALGQPEDLQTVLKKLLGRSKKYTLSATPDGLTLVETPHGHLLTTSEARSELARAGYVVADETLATPDAQGNYTMPAERPKGVLLRRVAPEFKPYSRDSAPAASKANFGLDVPVEGEPGVAAPSWIAHTSDTHQFNVSRMDERTFWRRLFLLVSYLNRLERQLRGGDPNERSFAEEVFSKLGTRKGKHFIAVNPRDHNAFLHLLATAESENEELIDSAMANNSIRLINRSGPLRLYVIDTPEAVQSIASLPSKWVKSTAPGSFGQTGNMTRWCLCRDNYAKSYLASGGPYYLVTKEGDNYAMVQFGNPEAASKSQWAQDPDDRTISSAMAAEIAPLFAPFNPDVGDTSEGEIGFKALAAEINKLKLRRR